LDGLTLDAPAAAVALFDALPSLSGRLPHLPLGRFPTRVHRLDGVLPASVELWLKRDDESGAPYGGNKVRKLEFLLGEARARGRRRLVTVGGYGSHHVLATALYGAACGFSVDAVLFPQPVTDRVRENLLALAATGARLFPASSYAGVPLKVVRSRLGRGAHWIAPGGSSPVGTLGWVSAGFELAAQVRAGALPAPDVVYAALGSCGTVAGLWLGLRMARLATRVVGVRVVDRLVAHRRAAIKLAARTERLIARFAEPPPLAEVALDVDHRFFGPGYGHSTDEAEQAIAAAAPAVRLDPTYTGKAFAALLADARAGLLDGKRALFVDTYNSVDLSALIARSPGPPSLPPLLRRLFDATA